MPSIGNKTLSGLVNIETQLKGLVADLATQTKQREVKALLQNAHEEVGKTIQGMPTSDSSYGPVRKTLTSILNTLGGLQDGLNEGMGRKDFKAAIQNLKTRFIPKFRESVDALTKKIATQSSKLDEHGLLQSADGIYDELVKVSLDLKRLVRMLDTAVRRNDAEDAKQSIVPTRNRLDLVSAAYGMIPDGAHLDGAADSLVTIAGTLNTLSEYAKTNNKVSSKGLENLKKRIQKLDSATKEMHRLMMNNLLQWGDKPRPGIHQLLKKKMDGVTQPGAAPEKLVRTADEHLKEQITEVKGAKVSLPKTIKGPYDLIRAPVAAIFESHDTNKRDRPVSGGTVVQNFSKTALLNQFGIKHIMVEDYLILQEQLILAVDRKSVEAAVKSLNTRRRKSAAGDDFVQYATGVVELLNERGSEKYDLVTKSHTVNPRNSNMILFWVMPSRILDSLIRRGWNKLSRWDLPFDK